MDRIVLALVVLIEISFAFYCIITKSSQIRQKSLLRISAFLIFSIITFFNIIPFNFRYVAFGSMLLLFAIIGVINIIRNQNDRKPFKSSSTIYKTIGLIFLFVISLIPALLFPQNIRVIEVSGNYSVLSENYSYTDSSRLESYSDNNENRKLNVRFWYPDVEQKRMPQIGRAHV